MFRHLLLNTIGLTSLLLISPLSAQTSYTAKWQVRHFATGALAPAQMTTDLEARRRDGSVVRLTGVTSPAGEQGQAIEIIDLVNHQRVLVEPFTASKTTVNISAAEAMLLQLAADSCKQSSTSPDMQSTRLGRSVVLLVAGQPDSATTKSEWHSPELGCASLESTVANADGSHIDRTVFSLETNQPSESIFQVPSGLVERSENEVAQAYRQKYGQWLPK